MLTPTQYNWLIGFLVVAVLALIVGFIVYGVSNPPATPSTGPPIPPPEDNTANIDQKLQSPAWTIMTWLRVKQPNSTGTAFSKGNSPQLVYEGGILKYKWTTPTGKKLETKGNAFTMEKPLTEWKQFVWTQNQNKMRFYEDGKLFYENDPASNTHVIIAPGTGAFGQNNTLELSNPGVFATEMTAQEIMDSYLKEKPMETMTVKLTRSRLRPGQSLVPIGKQ